MLHPNKSSSSLHFSPHSAAQTERQPGAAVPGPGSDSFDPGGRDGSAGRTGQQQQTETVRLRPVGRRPAVPAPHNDSGLRRTDALTGAPEAKPATGKEARSGGQEEAAGRAEQEEDGRREAGGNQPERDRGETGARGEAS